MLRRLLNWVTSQDRLQLEKIIEQQNCIIYVLQQRAALVDLRANGREIAATFLKDNKQVVLTFYNAGMSVPSARKALGLDG